MQYSEEPRKTIDVTRPLYPGMPVWPGDPEFTFESVSPSGGPRVSRLSMGTHAGTHVDAPAHVIEGGATVDALDPSLFIGPCYLIQLDADGSLGEETYEVGRAGLARALRSAGMPAEQLASAGEEGLRVLIGPEVAVLSEDAAAYLLELGAILVGVAAASVEEGDAALPVHRLLLGAGVPVIEGLRIDGVRPGRYLLNAAPILIAGADGAPVRATLTYI